VWPAPAGTLRPRTGGRAVAGCGRLRRAGRVGLGLVGMAVFARF